MTISIGTGQKNSIRDIIIVSLAMIVFGIIFIVINANQLNKTSGWDETSGTIVEIVSNPSPSGNIDHDVYVDYYYKEQYFEHRLLNSYESTMYVGKIVTLRVNPTDPNQFIYGEQGFFTAFFAIGGSLIGLGVLIPSIAIPYKLYKKKKSISSSITQETNIPGDIKS